MVTLHAQHIYLAAVGEMLHTVFQCVHCYFQCVFLSHSKG
jgi:hypothetical protein